MAHERAPIVAVDLSASKPTLPPGRNVGAALEAAEPQESLPAEPVYADLREQDYLIPFSCRLPISLHKKLDELKRERGLDKTEVVKAALAVHLKKLGK